MYTRIAITGVGLTGHFAPQAFQNLKMANLNLRSKNPSTLGYCEKLNPTYGKAS